MDPLTLAAIGASISGVSRAISVVRQSIDAGKDISEIAGSIDRLMTSHDQAEKALRAKAKAKAKPKSVWDKLIRSNLGDDDSDTSLAAAASLEIAERKMKQQMRSLEIQLNKSFGADTWQSILDRQAKAKEVKRVMLEKGAKLAAERKEAAALQQRSLLKKIAIEFGKVIIVGLFLVGMVLLLMHLKASN